MQRAISIYQIQNPLDQLVSFTVDELPQGDLTTQVRILIGVTSGAPERAFARNLNR